MAGENKIGSVFLEIGVISAAFSKGLEDARKQAEALGKNFDKNVRTISDSFDIAGNRAKAFGDKTGGLAEKHALLKQKINELIDKGLKPENQELQKLTASYNKLDAELKQHQATQSRLTQGVMSYLGPLATVTGALVALRSVYTGLIQPAMRAQEATSKFNTIFGAQAAGVTAWSEQLGQAIGRSSRELQGMAADAMALISPLTGGGAAAVRMSQGLVQMAQDLASFNNVSVDEALTALRSGISGESEPMKRFGILLTETALKEYALSQGIRKRVSDMTTAELTQLRYNAMLHNMGVATGDAERTSGSLTNRMRALEDATSDQAVAIGTKLLPGMTMLVDAMVKNVNSGGGLASMFLKMADDGNVLLTTAAGLVRILGAGNNAAGQTSGWDKFRNGLSQISALFSPVKASWEYTIWALDKINKLLGNTEAISASFSTPARALQSSLTAVIAAIPRTAAAAGNATNAAAQAAYQKALAARQKYADLIAQATMTETQLIQRAAEAQRSELEASLGRSLQDRKLYEDALVALDTETKRKIKEADKKQEEERTAAMLNNITTLSSTAGGMVGQLGALFAMDAQNRTSALDIQMQKEMETIGARYEAEKGMIEKSGDDATTKAAKLKALDEKRAREEKTLRDKTDKDKRKIEREAAKRAKMIAIAETLLAIPQMAIQTYLSVVKFVGPIGAAIAAAAATALGFAKLALIQQTPLPEAAYGMYGETPFIAGERGPEVAFSLDSERGKKGLRTFAQQLIGEVGRQQDTGASVVAGGREWMIRNIVQLDSTVIYDKVSKATEDGLITINVRSLVGA